MSCRAFLVATLFSLGLLSTQFAAAQADEPKKAPEQFKVEFETSAGNFTVEVTRKWAPIGADRFHELVEKKFYKDCRFFRVLPGFMVQWGINGDPEVQAKWKDNTIKDEAVVASNQKGFITYAKSGAPNSRTTQLFINYGDNARLDGMGFAPFGRVIKGMEVVEKINSKHGETPRQDLMQTQGNAYLNETYPDLDHIKSVKFVK